MTSIFKVICISGMLGLSGCATAAIGSAVVGGVAKTTKYAVKGTVGAGKLVYRGTKAAVQGTKRLLSDDEPMSEKYE